MNEDELVELVNATEELLCIPSQEAPPPKMKPQKEKPVVTPLNQKVVTQAVPGVIDPRIDALEGMMKQIMQMMQVPAVASQGKTSNSNSSVFNNDNQLKTSNLEVDFSQCNV